MSIQIQQLQLSFDFIQCQETSQHAFNLRARTLPTLAFPVPTLQPAQPNSPIALDLQPTGTPTPVNGEVTWFDACDADILQSNANPVGCAHLGIRPDGAFVAYNSYNGAPVKPLLFGINSVPSWGVNYNGILYPVNDNVSWIGSPANRVHALYLPGGEAETRLASIEARLAAHGL